MTKNPKKGDLLEAMTAIDTAWNRRDWDSYGALLHDGFDGFMGGAAAGQDKHEHVQGAIQFCEIFPDNQVITDPYVFFVEGSAGRSCSVARITGTMSGELTMEARVIKPNYRSIDVTFTVICQWDNGRIRQQWEYFDTMQMLRQLQIDL